MVGGENMNSLGRLPAPLLDLPTGLCYKPRNVCDETELGLAA
jgi:hypothetical protein